MDTSSYMMIPVVPGGRSREKVDCWGLVVLIYAELLSVALPLHEDVNWKDSGPDKVAATVAADALAEWDEVVAQDRREYDVVILRLKGVPWHVGVLVDKDRFIHADPVRGMCVERLEALHWKSRVVGYNRLKSHV